MRLIKFGVRSQHTVFNIKSTHKIMISEVKFLREHTVPVDGAICPWSLGKVQKI